MSYRAKSDEELVFLVQSGNKDALEHLVKRYELKVRHIVRDFPVAGYELDDRVSEATFGFLKAIKRYDPAHGTMFRTFMKQCVKRALIELWRKANRTTNVPSALTLRLDDSTEESHSILESLASSDDTAMEALARIEAEDTDDEMARMITEAIVGAARGEHVLDGELRSALVRFATAVFGIEKAADLEDLIGDPEGQLVLVWIGAERGTHAGMKVAAEVSAMFTTAARRIIELTLGGMRSVQVCITLDNEGLPLDRRTVSKIVQALAFLGAA